VRDSLWDEAAEAAMGHIELARWADAVLVAPATADFLARLSHGSADDLLATLCLATTAPLYLAPAMNQQMWANPATVANVSLLKDRGATILGPGEGDQACGETGPGRMLEPEQLAELTLSRLAANQVLAGQRVVVSAGPTRERLDPVRFISNRSSGKMGYAVAQAARDAGASVVLVSGPVGISPPSGVEFVLVESAEQMYGAVHRALVAADIYIGAAAVADYQAPAAATRKIKKSADRMQIELVRAPDILASVAALGSGRPYVVGFAAETENLEENARAKLAGKRMDMIAANTVGDDLAFDREDNSLLVIWPGGRVEFASCGKHELARRLVALIAEVRGSRRAAGTVAAVRA
jgi:phosphopantothenoylcysteine decarboxylase/phosphopantothenate--cysteine ligase